MKRLRTSGEKECGQERALCRQRRLVNQHEWVSSVPSTWGIFWGGNKSMYGHMVHCAMRVIFLLINYTMRNLSNMMSHKQAVREHPWHFWQYWSCSDHTFHLARIMLINSDGSSCLFYLGKKAGWTYYLKCVMHSCKMLKM